MMDYSAIAGKNRLQGPENTMKVLQVGRTFNRTKWHWTELSDAVNLITKEIAMNKTVNIWWEECFHMNEDAYPKNWVFTSSAIKFRYQIRSPVGRNYQRYRVIVNY
jgi:hypothetical protein